MQLRGFRMHEPHPRRFRAASRAAPAPGMELPS